MRGPERSLARSHCAPPRPAPPRPAPPRPAPPLSPLAQVAGYSPFADPPNNDQMVICRNILKGEVAFPAHVKDKDLRDLIQKLLVKDVPRRLGCLLGGAQDIRQHRFFRPLDFDELFARRVQAPWRPALKSQLDTGHFDEYDEEDEVDEYDGDEAWCASF